MGPKRVGSEWGTSGNVGTEHTFMKARTVPPSVAMQLRSVRCITHARQMMPGVGMRLGC